MSRQQRPSRPILAKDVEQRLAAIVHRLGGTPYTAPEPGKVELPSDAWHRRRFAVGGQLDLFDHEQYVPYELRRGRLG